MKRKLTDDISKKKVNWTCDGCKGILANPYPKEDNKEVEYMIGKEKTKTKKVKELRIIQWNADAYLSKKEEFANMVYEKKIDIFAIQETKMISDDNTPTLPGYEIKRREREQTKEDKTNRGGGLIIGIRDNLPVNEIQNNLRGDEDEITEWMTIEIPGKNKIRITNMYIPPIRETEGERKRNRGRILDTSKWPCGRDDIILGDINAHSSIWDNACRTRPELQDERGEMIEQWLMETEMACLNDGRPTRNARKDGQLDTAPDLSIVHATLVEKFTWEPLDITGSDHKPILITYKDEFDTPEVNNTTRYKWKLAKGDWEKFTEQVERELPTDYSGKSIQQLEETFRKTVLDAAKKHIKKKKINAKTRIDLGDEVKQEAAHRNKMRAKIAEAEEGEERSAVRKEWKESSRRVAEMTKVERSKKWTEFVDGIDPKTDSSKVWQTIRNLEGKNSHGGKTNTLVIEDKAYVTDKDKANQFAKTYKGFSKLQARKDQQQVLKDRAMRRHVRKTIKKKPTVIEESEQDIRMIELERAIEESKKGKAAGEDDIPYEMLKNLGEKAKHFLLHLFNEIWKGNELPTAWRNAIIKPLLKPGKDPKDTVSYRPIALTSCVGKILERIVADRLMYVLECRGVINNNQAGFRQNRATTDQVLKLIQSASDQIHSKGSNKSTICTFFDYEKAYDKVWRDGLMYKMVEMGIPGRFLRYTRHFLSGRVTTTMINGVKSNKFRLNEGLPQGSCISPLLFLLFINDIDTELHPDTLVSLFADDTAIWCQTGRNLNENIKQMQEEINKIWNWAKKWKMKINESKTKTLIISTKADDYKRDPGLKLNGKDVAPVEIYKFLGIQADNGIRFNKCVNDNVKKNLEKVNIMRCLGGKDWGQTMESQKSVYMGYIRSCLENASSSRWPWISKTAK